MPDTKASKSEPMDPTVREARVGTPATHQQRVCYAAKTLVAEVHEMFPDLPVEYSNYNGRNTALDVSFDTTVLDTPEALDLGMVLELLDGESRVSEVIVEDDVALVSFKNNPRTQDSKEPFGLADGIAVLSDYGEAKERNASAAIFSESL